MGIWTPLGFFRLEPYHTCDHGVPPMSGSFLPLCVQVWSLEQPEWHCRIDEGSAGLVASCWSPDGRHILNTTEFHVSGGTVGHEARVMLMFSCLLSF